MKASSPPTDSVFEPIERSGVAQDGIKMLKAMILRGDLVAGQRLPPERELAEMLGISRPTLRESIRALIALNIVDSRHGHGTYVTSLDPQLLSEPIDFVFELHRERLQDLFETRKIIEPALAALAAERITDEQLAELDRITAERFDALETRDWQEAIDLDLKFHSIVAEAAGNSILLTMLSSVTTMSRASRELSTERANDHYMELASQDLQDILTALRKKDPEASAAAMSTHLGRVSSLAESAFDDKA